MAASFNLPAPVLSLVFQNLPFKDLTAAARVCKFWNAVANSDPLWRFHSRMNLGVIECDPAFSCKEWYRLLTKKVYNFTQFHLLGRKIILVWDKSFCFDETTNYQLRGLTRGRVVISDHTQNITCSNVQERGRNIHFFTGSFDRMVKIWEINAASDGLKHLQTLQKHAGMITAITSNLHYLFSGSTDKTIAVWKYKRETKEYIYSQSLSAHDGSVASLSVNKAGDYPILFSASSDKTIKIWKGSEGIFEHYQTLIGHQSEVTNIKFLQEAATHPQLISGDSDGKVRIWQEQYNRFWSCVNVIQAHTHPISSICCYREPKSFCTGGGYEVKLWKISKKGKQYEPAKITQITNVLICKMLFNNHIGHCEDSGLFILTEKEIQISWVDDEGISTTNKTIEFPDEICHNKSE